MNFKDFKYERISLEVIEKRFNEIFEKLENAESEAEFIKYFKEVNEFRNYVYTMSNLSSIRNSIDTSDIFYDEENTYWDNTGPYIFNLITKFYKICLNSKFKDNDYIPKIFFDLAKVSLETFDEKIITESQIENKLSSEYSKLIASAKIEFEGEVYNISSIGKKINDQDREVRKNAYLALSKFFEENEAEFDRIYDELVKVRHQIATKLGYQNYTELAYKNLARLDYNQEDVKKFRQQIIDEVVPFSAELLIKQKERLGLDELRIYDKNYTFKTGNPIPKGNVEELIAKADKMYQEMSKETNDFFKMMLDKQLFDLESKDNKMAGGYCSTLPLYKAPFIFANFKGTKDDVDVLTHEAGHAFQAYLTSLENDIPECAFPTMETAEIHSMSMEFFAYPWIDNFFKEDSDKYYYSHIAESIKFLPYGSLVDHFQHEIYNNPNLSKEERKLVWKKLEAIYLKEVSNGEIEFLNKGTYWYRQGHIFSSPFYYIDYCIAQICAFQFYIRSLKDKENTWNDYLKLCRNGGTKTFLENIKDVNIKSPFEYGTIKEVISEIKNRLEKYDVTKF